MPRHHCPGCKKGGWTKRGLTCFSAGRLILVPKSVFFRQTSIIPLDEGCDLGKNGWLVVYEAEGYGPSGTCRDEKLMTPDV